MPALANAKHERFAQLLAKGRGQAEAYAEVGYKPSEPNASRLRSSDKVSARVTELLDRAAVRTEITVASITDRLLKIAAKGEGDEIKDASLLSVARACLMDAAKLNGLVIEKAVVAASVSETTDRPARETREEWLARRATLVSSGGTSTRSH